MKGQTSTSLGQCYHNVHKRARENDTKYSTLINGLRACARKHKSEITRNLRKAKAARRGRGKRTRK